MLPDRWPDTSPPDAPDAPDAPQPETPPPGQVRPTALALFVLGVTVGLLAVLGRIAQELELSLLADLNAEFWPAPAGRSRLPAMLHGLDTPGQRLVAAGFAASVVGMVCGAALWRAGGRLSTRHRAWTRLGALIMLALLAAMIGTLVCPDAAIRLALLISAFIPAALLFVVLVAWIVTSSLHGG